MSRSVTDPRLCFLADYYDELAALTREYQLFFYFGDKTIEMNDLKARRSFLKRTPCPALDVEHFFLGARVVVFGRVLKLVAYGDEVTRQLSEKRNGSTIIALSEARFAALGKDLSVLSIEAGFTVREMNTVCVSAADAEARGMGVAFAGRRVLVVSCIRNNAMERGVAVAERLGASGAWAARNAEDVAWGDAALRAAPANPVAIFGGPSGSNSVVIVKPHVLAAGFGPEVVQRLIDSGLSVVAAMQSTLSNHKSELVLGVYKGILADYNESVQHLSSGPTWVLQLVAGPSLKGRGVSVVDHVRELCGPFDPVVAKHLQPSSLRAKYGVDRVRNAVHCSDLPDDGNEDAELFFVTIAGSA